MGKKNRLYPPDDPRMRYTGRVDFSNPLSPKFSAPGVTIEARFRGSSIAAILDDEFRGDNNRNFYDVLIDGVKAAKLAMRPAVKRYELASELPSGEHSLSLVKRTESMVGYGQFLGLECDGELLPAAARPTRQIEFIGDSIACGSGNEAVNESPECLEEGWGQPYQNARLSFGAILAHNLNAECHITAVAGIGLVRNYSFQYDTRPLPEVYDSIFTEQTNSPAWDHTRFIPDAVIIALGTNDFSPGDSPRPDMPQNVFVDAYLKFIDKLKGYYPNAHIFCVSSPMLGDGWPAPHNQFASDQRQAIARVVDIANGSGNSKVHKFFVAKVIGAGCGTHPSVEQHILMAREIEPFISSTLGWNYQPSL